MTHAYGKSLLPSTVGFDRLFTTLNEFEELFEHKKPATYPPYNIVKFDDDNYQIQIAVAGFDKDEIEIDYRNNQLTVNGSIKTAQAEVEYLHRGLSSRDFTHSFKLSYIVVVKFSDLINCVLKINLVNDYPEEKKPRKIEIGDPPSLTCDKK